MTLLISQDVSGNVLQKREVPPDTLAWSDLSRTDVRREALRVRCFPVRVLFAIQPGTSSPNFVLEKVWYQHWPDSWISPKPLSPFLCGPPHELPVRHLDIHMTTQEGEYFGSCSDPQRFRRFFRSGGRTGTSRVESRSDFGNFGDLPQMVFWGPERHHPEYGHREGAPINGNPYRLSKLGVSFTPGDTCSIHGVEYCRWGITDLYYHEVPPRTYETLRRNMESIREVAEGFFGSVTVQILPPHPAPGFRPAPTNEPTYPRSVLPAETRKTGSG